MVTYICDTFSSRVAPHDPLEHFGVIDSGNNKHHCFTDNVFFPAGVKWTNLRITGAHGAKVVRVGRGTAQFLTRCDDGTYAEWNCPDSIYNPHSPVTLLCMDRFMHSYPDYHPTGHDISFKDCQLLLRKGRVSPFHQHPESRLYQIELIPRVLESPPVAILFKRTQLRNISTTSALRRLSYPLEKYFNITKQRNMLEGIHHLPSAPQGAYAKRGRSFYAGKLTQRTIQQHHARKPTRPGSDIYSDIVGPFPVPTREGHRYCAVYKDSFTQHLEAYLMKAKDELLDTWKTYIADMRSLSRPATPLLSPDSSLFYPHDPEFCISDAEEIYVAGDFNRFNRDNLIGHWTVAPYTHSANPAEPAIRRILEAATASLDASGLPPSFALYAVLHAVKGINRCFTPVHYCPEHQYITPQERRLGTKPHIDDIPPFGCLAFVHIPRDHRRKCEAHSWSGFYAGPAHNMKGYRIFRPSTNQIYDRYHTVFDDTVTYGDFMGRAYQERVRADALQREYHNAEISALLGTDPRSDPLVELLRQHPGSTLPDPDASPPGNLSNASNLINPLVTAGRPHLAGPSRLVADARLRQLTDADPTPDQALTRTGASNARNTIAREQLDGVTGTPSFDPFPVVAEPSPIGLAATPLAPPLTRPPLTAEPERAREGVEAPLSHRAIRALQGPHAREALLHAADAYLCLQQEHGIDFFEPEFIADLHAQDIAPVGVTMLQLHADSTRLQLNDETRRRIAATVAPSTQRQIDALSDSTEGQLIREAQIDEIESMISEGRVLPVDLRTLPDNVRQIDGKWVVKYKKQLDGLLERVRARWTLRGDRQIPHRDYDPDKIYSPVASKTTHFTLFAIAVQFGLYLWSLDVAKAFMLGPIDTRGLLMRVPKGFRDKIHPDYCPFGKFTTYELLCSLYGLKQAAAVYYDTMKNLLLSHVFPDGSRFRLSPADPCLFVRGSLSDLNSPYIAISTHIDDKFIACRHASDKDAIAGIFSAANWNFTLQAMDLVLGIHIRYERWDSATDEGGTLKLDHEQYISDAYRKFSPLIPKDRRGSNTNIPVSASTIDKLNAQGPAVWSNYCKRRHTQFRSLLGTLGHVANFTHPEIAFAISFASQFMSNPSEAHLDMVLGILMYLYSTRTKRITFKRQHSPPGTNPIFIACDSDLGNSRSRRSRTAFCAYLYGNLVAWHSRLQQSVSLSTAEAEYMALAAAARFAVWYKPLVGDFGIERSYRDPVHIFSDNKSAICIAKNPISHKHSRHIDRRLHWLREKVLAGVIQVAFIPTADNVSDIMTKALAVGVFRPHRDKLLDGYYFINELASCTQDNKQFIVCLSYHIDAIMMNEL